MRHIFLTIIALFYAFSCDGSYLNTSDVSLIKKIIMENKGAETLVGFDIDDVLIMPTEDYYVDHPIRKKLLKAQKLRLSTEHFEALRSKFIEQR